MNAATVTGLKFKIGKYKFRFWKSGFEYGTNSGGRVIFYPWVKVGKKLTDQTWNDIKIQNPTAKP